MTFKNIGNSGFITIFAVGFGVGAALALLFAPGTGDETRKYLRDTAQDGMDDAVASGKQAVKKLRKHAATATEFANDVAETVQSTLKSASEAIS